MKWTLKKILKFKTYEVVVYCYFLTKKKKYIVTFQNKEINIVNSR